MHKSALGRVLGAGGRRLVRQCRLGVAAQTTEQVGPDRLEHVVVVEAGSEAGSEAVDEGECRSRSLGFGHRDRAVEGRDRVGGEGRQLVATAGEADYFGTTGLTAPQFRAERRTGQLNR